MSVPPATVAGKSFITVSPIAIACSTRLGLLTPRQIRQTAEQEYGLDLEEHALGLQCIAVPISNLHAQYVAAVSVSCPIATISRETLETDVLEKLQATGLRISKAMGYIATE